MDSGQARTFALDMSDANRGPWAFVGGAWQQDESGVMTASDQPADENLAFHTGQAFGDFEAEFEFRWDSVWTTAGLVFRARDARHYYVLDFPVVGQQYRAEHFWMTLARVDDRGFREGLEMKLVSGVSSAPNVWHKARLRARGVEVRVWLEDRLVTTVHDGTYSQPGYVGLDTYNAIAWKGPKASFRNLRVTGVPTAAPRFKAEPAPVRTWRTGHPDPTMGCGRIVRAGNGDLLVGIATEPTVSAVDKGNWLCRSSDNGRTWAAQRMPQTHQSPLLRSAPDGTLEMYRNTYPGLPSTILKATSADCGTTWSEFREVGRMTPPAAWPYGNFGFNTMLETRDGGLVLCGVSSGGVEDVRTGGRWNLRFAALASFCLRSDDGGESWSEPADMDGPPHNEAFMMTMKCGCEISVAELPDGTLFALNRPIWSPFMWETRSFDGGRTWTPMSRGSFPMYASCSSMICTSSGVVLIGGRFPGLAVQMSRDLGATWQFYQIDTAAWANGAMFEVEPDVVLYMYGGREEFRYQILTVTPTGLETA